MVQALGLRDLVLGFRVEGLGWVQALGLGDLGLGIRV